MSFWDRETNWLHKSDTKVFVSFTRKSRTSVNLFPLYFRGNIVLHAVSCLLGCLLELSNDKNQLSTTSFALSRHDCLTYWLVMESQDFVSVSRLVSRPIFACLGLSLEGPVSDSGLQVSVTAYCLENLNIEKKWLGRTSIIQRVFCSLHLQVRNNQNRSEKCPKFEKNKLRSDDNIFLKNFRKIHKFWSLDSQSRNFWWSLGDSVSDVLTRSRFRRLRSRLHHWYWPILTFLHSFRHERMLVFKITGLV